MEARKSIAEASFGPEALRVIRQAFDAARVEIAGNFGDDPAQLEAALAETCHGDPFNRQQREPRRRRVKESSDRADGDGLSAAKLIVREGRLAGERAGRRQY